MTFKRVVKHSRRKTNTDGLNPCRIQNEVSGFYFVHNFGRSQISRSGVFVFFLPKPKRNCRKKQSEKQYSSCEITRFKFKGEDRHEISINFQINNSYAEEIIRFLVHLQCWHSTLDIWRCFAVEIVLNIIHLSMQ